MSMAEVIPITKFFKSGSQGSEVAELQAKLKRLGLFVGTLDGVFGEELEHSVKAFQAANSMQADGIVDPGTVAAINRALTAQGEPATLAQLVSPDLAQQVRAAAVPSTALVPVSPSAPVAQSPGLKGALAQIPRGVYIAGGVIAAAVGLGMLWLRSRESVPSGEFADFEDEDGLDDDSEFEDRPTRKKPKRKKTAKKKAASKKETKKEDDVEDDDSDEEPEEDGAAAEA